MMTIHSRCIKIKIRKGEEKKRVESTVKYSIIFTNIQTEMKRDDYSCSSSKVITTCTYIVRLRANHHDSRIVSTGFLVETGLMAWREIKNNSHIVIIGMTTSSIPATKQPTLDRG